MTTIWYVETNALALTILLLILFNINKNSEKFLLEQKLFVTLILTVAVLLTSDAIMRILEGVKGPAACCAMVVSTVIYYIFSPLPCYFWSLYADYQLCMDKTRLQKLSVLLLPPVIFNALLSFSSIFTGRYFYFDSDNRYHRGILFGTIAIVALFYIIYTGISIIRKKSTLDSGNFIAMLLFAVPPVLGGVIQAFFYGLTLIWICTTISIMVVFFKIQNVQLYTDYLTGLYNRRQLDNYLNEHIKNFPIDLAGIMIDLNAFKQINDKWGHDAGDSALVTAAKLITESFRKNDLICRYGGDEFVIILKVTDKSEINSFVEKLMDNVSRFNSQRSSPYSIHFSIGFDTYSSCVGMTAQQFLRHIDKLMYIDKNCKKQKQSKQMQSDFALNP